MKKIMFNDKYGLTAAVLSGRKTQTRRVIPRRILDEIETFLKEYHNCPLYCISHLKSVSNNIEQIVKTPYRSGEIVAIAQSYKDACVLSLYEEDEEFGCYDFPAEQTNGWSNKMFVRADLMPNKIRISKVRAERLQDISREDCIKEGLLKSSTGREYYISYETEASYCGQYMGYSPRQAFAHLIDLVFGQGTWESNPYVFVYDFELVV